MGRGSPVPDALRSRRRLLRFAVVGGVGFAVDQAVLISLIELVDAPLELAKVASAEAAIVVMFVVNDRWTFARWGAVGVRAQARRLAKSNAVRIGGIAVSVVVLSALVRLAGVPYPVANAIGIGFGFLVNYTLESLVTWRTATAPSEP